MLATVNATAWRLEIGSPNALAVLDVVGDVVEHGLAGADGQRAPGQAAELATHSA